MAKIIFHADQLAQTGGVQELELEANTYRHLLQLLAGRYTDMQADYFDRYMVCIDGVIIQTPFLEALASDSEVIFIRKHAAG